MRFRFSLRFLLAAFTVVAIGLGVVAQDYYRMVHLAQQQQAIEANLTAMGFFTFRQSGCGDEFDGRIRFYLDSLSSRWNRNEDFLGSTCFFKENSSQTISSKEAEHALFVLKDLRGVRTITLEVEKITPGMLSLIRGHRGLEELRLYFGEFDPRAATGLGDLQQIQSLKLSGILSDEILLALGRLRALDSLEIDATGVSNHALATIGKLPKLGFLGLHGTLDGPEPLAGLRREAAIGVLRLSKVTMNESAAEGLAQIDGITRIIIEGDCKLPDSFWEGAAKLRNIEDVFLKEYSGSCKTAIELLAKSATLKDLTMESNRLSIEEVRMLQGHATLEQFTFRGALTEEEIEEFLDATPRCALSVIEPVDKTEGKPQGIEYSRSKDGKTVEDAWPRWIF